MGIESIFNNIMNNMKFKTASADNVPSKQEYMDKLMQEPDAQFLTLEDLLAKVDNHFSYFRSGSGGRDIVDLTPENDELRLLNPKNLTIYAKNGDDRITSVLGHDVGIFGDNGHDSLTMFGAQEVDGSGYNQINGGMGNDKLELTYSNDAMAYGGDGDDSAYLMYNKNSATSLGNGNDKLFAVGMQNDKRTDMFAGTGDDNAFLLGGSNVGYFAGDGDDHTVIASLVGNSRIQGDGGKNTYTFLDNMSDGLILDGKTGFDSVDVSAYYGEDGHPKPGHVIDFLGPYDGSGVASFILKSPGENGKTKTVRLLDIEELIRNGEVIFPKDS